MKRAMLRSGFTAVLAAVFGFFFLGAELKAQSTTDGAIGGTVYDASGAVLSGAKVTVHNDGTNNTQVETTDESGYYRVSKLRPATYTVTIDAQGFARFRAEEVVVQVGTITDLSAHMQISSTGATVLVTGEAPQINTTSADFAPLVDQVQISNLPINGGRWSDFALLTPGVVNDSSGFGLLSFRGQSTLMNNNTVDGADNNQAFFSEERGRTRAGYSSAKAAVQEFQVNTSNYTSEYGRASGAVVNTVTKSGTNSLHGEAYFYDRDNEWGATNPFTTLTTQTAPGVFTTSPIKPTDKRKIYGLGIGGPIIKDKLFFYFAFDRYDRNFPGVAVPSNPSSFFAAPVADLGAFGGSCATLNAASFSNANALNATRGACTLMSNLNLPTYAAAVTDYNNGLNGLLTELGTVPRKGQQTIFFPKIDWQINSKNHATFEVNRMRWASPAGIQTQTSVTDGTASFGNDYVRDTWGVAKLYTLINSNVSNEARFQYGRDFEFEFAQPSSPFELANFVNPPGYTNPLGLSPDVFITNGFDMGVPTFLQRPAFPDERRTQFADTVSWTHRNHTLKFGVDYAHTNDLSENLRFQYGSFSYSTIGNFLSDFYKPNSCGTAHTQACYSSFQQAFGPLGFTFNTNDYAFFAEDSWRVMPRFTVTLGLRYEYEQLPSVLPNLINPAIPLTTHLPSDKDNFGPRVGVAWDVFGDGKTSVRAGYGLFYGRIINSTIYNALINTGNLNGQLSFNFIPTTPGAPKFPQIAAAAPVTTSTSGLAAVFLDRHLQAPQVHEADLTFEQEIGWGTSVSVSYLGSFGHSLPNFVDTNIAPSASTITYAVAGGGPVTAPTYTTSLFKGPRPNPNYGAITDVFSGVRSNYNAVTVQLNHRLRRNVQFGANYTWAHALDNGENATTFSDTNDLLNPFNTNQEYGNSNFDVPNRFVLNAVVTSPWHREGWLNYLVSGWEVAPIYQVQNGLPYSLVTSGNAPGGLAQGVNGSNGRKGLDNVGRNAFRLPRTQVVDMRLSKKIPITEKFNLEFIGEGFNLFNHVNVTSVNTTGYIVTTTGTITNANGTITCSTAAPCLNFNAPFGAVTNANSNFAYTSRQVQLGLRFLF
jgi:Carboxypeptidase regulatory-like domain/TonB dependent receptor